MWKIWVILAGIFLIAEISTAGFLVFWFAIGALIAMICSFFISNVIIQTTVFVISSTVLLFFTRNLTNKLTKTDTKSTNVYSIIGKKGIVTTSINNISGEGQIKVNSEIWSAKSKDNINIEKGAEIEIVDVDGVKAIVK